MAKRSASNRAAEDESSDAGRDPRVSRLEPLANGSTRSRRWDQVRGASLFVFTPAEEVAIGKILQDFPGAAEALKTGMQPVLELLVRLCKGVVRSEEEADYVLAGLADRIVGRTITDTDTWDEADDLRTSAIDLLTRHLLAQVRGEFVRQVLAEGVLE
jgi:hypothetical protein